MEVSALYQFFDTEKSKIVKTDSRPVYTNAAGATGLNTQFPKTLHGSKSYVFACCFSNLLALIEF